MQPKTKIKDIYYLFHPNFVQDDTDPKGYRLTKGGQWIVEWDVYTYPIHLSSVPEHHTESFEKKSDAKKLYNKLMKCYEKQQLKKG